MSVGYDVDSYSFHIVNPSAFSGDGGDSSPLITKTIFATDIYSAMDMLNSEMSEKCDFSHIKTVIFSKDKLNAGVLDEIEAMYNSKTFHPNIRVAMCTGTVAEYMKNFKIPLNTNPAEFYENIFSEDSNPYSPDTTLKDMQKSYQNQVAANVLPILDNSTKTAITKNCKLSGTTSLNESILYNLLTKKSFNCNYPINEDTVLRLKNEGVKIAVNFKDKTPKVFVNIKLGADVVWSTKNTDMEKLQKTASHILTKEITTFMNNCSSKYKADIFSLYKYAKINYLTIENWENENWQQLFEQANYSVNVNLKIKRKGLN